MSDTQEPNANSARWYAILGPGAIIASLTIGAGELVFSSRGGAIFGYRLIGLFALICIVKWCLVFVTARHMVLTGAHPFQRWAQLPGPQGWLPFVFLLLAVPSFPVWVSFHAGTIGTLLAALTETQGLFRGAGHFVWGLGALLAVVVLSLTGNYRRLERIQLVLVFVMLGSVCLSLLFLRPNLIQMVYAAFQLPWITYPDWIAEKYPTIAAKPVIVELATYVGVVGGSGYDYLAYVSFLREKQWGHAATDIPVSLDGCGDQASADMQVNHREVLRLPLYDSMLSFLIVFLFSIVFLTCGTLVLGPLERVPANNDLLTLQAEFVNFGGRWLRPVYFAGALLAMIGTLYGTIEVAPAVMRELVRAIWSTQRNNTQRLDRGTRLWVGIGGAIVLMACLVYFLQSGESKPIALDALLRPANLFTGVLACGVICLLSIWADLRWLPKLVRPNTLLIIINLLAGVALLALGLKTYFDQYGSVALAALAATLLAGWLLPLVRIVIAK